MTRFLEKQTDFSEIRNKAIQKVIKQELMEKQAEEAEARKQKVNLISVDNLSDKEQESNNANNPFNFPLEGITLRNRNRNVKMVDFSLVSPV